ncbi:energy transducer TonB [Pseudomonas caspiana]
MSDIQQSSIGYLTHAGDFTLRNSRALGGVTQIWSDAFARVMAEQLRDNPPEPVHESAVAIDVASGEPVAGARTLGKIVEQRACPVQDMPRVPAVPLFLPIAEFELDLLPPPNEPFSLGEMIAQQRNLEFDSQWVRPNVLTPYDDSVIPGPGPEPRPLHLPIAEFEWDLADKPALPLDEETLIAQQRALDFDSGWARPIILQNLRMAA